MLDFNSVLGRFSNPKKIKAGKNCIQSYQVNCPCTEKHKHGDKDASLTVSEGNDGKILFCCHAGCDYKDILSHIGLKESDIHIGNTKLSCLDRLAWYYGNQYEWTDGSGKKHKGYGDGVRVVAEYPYYDRNGVYLYSKIRFEGGSIEKKLIRYYTVDRGADKATSCKKADTDGCLYRLPEFLRLKKHAQHVYIVEGEKDCETLRKIGHGFGCVTTAGSTTDWKPEFAPVFKGLKVIVIRDNDNAGFQLSEKIIRDLKPFAYYVKVVNPSKLDGGDVTDYLTKEGGTAQGLKDICDSVTSVNFASWVKIDEKGHDIGINAGILAEIIREHEQFVIQRNPRDDKDSFLLYEDGAYHILNKGAIKSMIKEYIPASKVSDNLLNNVSNLLFATTERVYQVSDFNNDQKYINFKDVLLNIYSWNTEKHTPDVLSTFQFDFDYVASKNLKPKNFIRFIRDLCTKPDGSVDQDEISIIQEYLGFLVSNVPMSKIKGALVLWSRLGNSGKSTFIRLLCKMFGLVGVASIKLTELTPDNRFILGTLPECRLIACGDESNANVKDSSLFKSLTGGDVIKAELKGKQGFSYEYRGGFVLACNGLPLFEDDKGNHLYDRLIILPCEHHISDEIKDAKMDEKLEEEIPSICIWALEGLKRLMDNEFIFTKSKSCELSKTEYRKQMDNVYRFVMDNYEITLDYNDRISKKDFDDAYHLWASSNETIKEVDRKNLSARLEAIGISSDMGNSGDKHHIHVYRGIKEKESDFVDAEDISDVFP